MTRLFPALLCAAALLATPVLADENIHVIDPWIRAAPPVAQIQAGYLTLHNAGGKEQSLVGATSPLFAKIELHETIQHDGQSHMQARPSIALPPGGQVALAPGGLHLMLIGPQRALPPMEKVSIVLQFADGSTVPVSAEVRAATSGDKGSEAAHDHQHPH
ncbi:MAG: copper chaperone PCu(A)C [Magnetococcales bacterium]|nr:copper chaperone PCu(A)C [Magnetococcales bacterium]